jgi:hypothetical protein
VTGETRLIHQNQKVSGLAAEGYESTARRLNPHRKKDGIPAGHRSCDLNTVNPMVFSARAE